MPAEGSCQALTERVPYVLAPTKLSGGPATLDGPLTLTVISGEGTITADPNDNLRGWVQTDTVGDVTFLLDGDGDLGAGRVSVQDTILLHGLGENAANLGTSLGAAEPRP